MTRTSFYYLLTTRKKGKHWNWIVALLACITCYPICLWLKDITTRVIAREVNLEDTPCSMVMTRNPVFVLTDTLAVEALQKMVQGW
jgi:CBS domain-containing protein